LAKQNKEITFKAQQYLFLDTRVWWGGNWRGGGHSSGEEKEVSKKKRQPAKGNAPAEPGQPRPEHGKLAFEWKQELSKGGESQYGAGHRFRRTNPKRNRFPSFSP